MSPEVMAARLQATAQGMLFPWGYEQTLVSLDRLIELELDGAHPEFVRRIVPWLVSLNGMMGIGDAGPRPNPSPVSLASRLGKSFHQLQRFASGLFVFSAADLVVRNPGGVHRAPTAAEVQTGLPYGIHANVGVPGSSGYESWHVQCIEQDGFDEWVGAGRPDPSPEFQLPPDAPIPTPPINKTPTGATTMKAIDPERAYDSRPEFQAEITPALAAANKDVPKRPFAAGTTRKIIVGDANCKEAFVNVTIVGATVGWVKVSPTETVPSSSIGNADGDGVSNGSTWTKVTNGAIYVTVSHQTDIVVDVTARG